jgi:iron complex transport system ATP-binding protein
MPTPLIEIRNVSFSIANKKILEDISLEIFAGDYLSIIGPNGAGKTTLLKCLMRIYPHFGGEIRLLGRSLAAYRQKELARHLSYVPQSDGRYFPFSVEEFVLMGRYPHLSPFTAIQEKDLAAARDALQLTDSAHLAQRQLSTLSGGEKQTVFIAAAIAQGSKILLLDEPTTFLDPKHQADIGKILQKLNRECEMTIISVTHDINQAALHSNRVVILKNGKLTFSGKAQEIMNNHILQPAYDKSFDFLLHPVTGQRIIAPEVG